MEQVRAKRYQPPGLRRELAQRWEEIREGSENVQRFVDSDTQGKIHADNDERYEKANTT